MQNARYQPVKGGTRRSEAKQVSSAFFNRTLQQSTEQLERTIWRRFALGVENFPRHKVDFAKDIAKSLTRRCKSRPTNEMSKAKLSKHSDDENDDFSLFDEFIFSSYVESDVSKRFPGNRVLDCRWDRVATTYVYNSRYRRSKFPYLSTALYDDFYRMTNV